MQEKYSRLDSLTSLRFFAAFGVFLLHYSEISGALSFPKLKIINTILAEGYVWVSFFFMLSGFILSYSYYSKKNIDSFSKFIFRRISKIYPIHLLMLILTIIFLFINGNSISIYNIFYNIFLIQSWNSDPSVYWGINAVSWSISDELFFYFLFIPLCRMRLKWLIFITFLILIIYLSIFIIHNESSYSKYALFFRWVFYISPAIRLIGFIAGILSFHAYEKIKLIKLDNYYNLMELSSIIIFSLFIYMSIHYNVNKLLRWDIYYTIPLSFIIISFSFQKGIISRILNNKIFVFLGNASFSLYMIHYLTIELILKFFTKKGTIDNILRIFIYLPFVSISVIFLASVVYLYFEKPANIYMFNKLINFSSRKKLVTIN